MITLADFFTVWKGEAVSSRWTLIIRAEGAAYLCANATHGGGCGQLSSSWMSDSREVHDGFSVVDIPD